MNTVTEKYATDSYTTWRNKLREYLHNPDRVVTDTYDELRQVRRFWSVWTVRFYVIEFHRVQPAPPPPVPLPTIEFTSIKVSERSLPEPPHIEFVSIGPVVERL